LRADIDQSAAQRGERQAIFQRLELQALRAWFGI
jgi:hypothetical protein